MGLYKTVYKGQTIFLLRNYNHPTSNVKSSFNSKASIYLLKKKNSKASILIVVIISATTHAYR